MTNLLEHTGVDDENVSFPCAEEYEEHSVAYTRLLVDDPDYARGVEQKCAPSKGFPTVSWNRSLAIGGLILTICGIGGLSTNWNSTFRPRELKAMSFDTLDNTQAWGIDLPNPSAWPETYWESTFEHFYNWYQKFVEYDLYSDEYRKKLDIFKTNLKKIWEHNNGVHFMDDVKDSGVKLAPNQFSDIDFRDFSHRKLMSAQTLNPLDVLLPRVDPELISIISRNATFPDEVNWLAKGCVTPVKDQQHCGSCWTFSATGAIEGAICAQTGTLFNLSEQQLVDCSLANHGCHGGMLDAAFEYVMKDGGLCTEDEYPYLGRESKCRANNCTKVAKIKGLLDVPPGNVAAMKAAVSLYGPVSVGIQADKPAFQFYHTGVFNLKCGKHLNHAVLVVGYGKDELSGEEYWLVKNSWGETWGDQGYIRISMALHKHHGECGILLYPSLPLVERQ